MKRLAILILIIGLWGHVGGQTLEDYSGQTAAQLSAMQDRVTVPNTSYWNTHAYLQLQTLIARVLTLSDSTGVFTPADSTISWAKLMTAVQDSIQLDDRISANGVLWAMLAAAVQDSITERLLITALTDSLDKYRTAYKLDTTAIDTSQYGKFVRDHESNYSYSLVDNAVTTAKLDTLAAGWLDVRKFGAVGNGTTDDTDAIHDALDYITGIGGGALFFPPGTYITTTDTIPSNTQLIGTVGSVIKLKSTTNSYMLFMDDADNIKITGLTLDGNNANNTTNALTATLIRADSTSNLIIEDCLIQNITSPAIYSPGGCAGAIIRDNTFINHGGAVNLYFSDSIKVTGNYMTNKNHARSSNPQPIDLVDVSYSEISYNTIIVEPYAGGTDDRFVIQIIDNAGANQRSNLVTHNIILCGTANSYYGGISLSESDYTTVAYNIIRNAKNIAAIELASSDYCSVTHNMIDSLIVGVALYSYTLGADVSSNYFTNSAFDDPWGNAINVDGSGADSTHNRRHIFKNNTFHRIYRALNFNGSGGWSAISNNQADSCSIFIEVAHGTAAPMNFMKIDDNECISTGKFFNLWQASTDTLKGWHVTDNKSVDQTSTNSMSVWLNYYAHGNIGVNLGNTAMPDSMSVGAGGIWMRNWFYVAADSSVAMTFYNTTLARLDTVYAKQP